VKLLWCWRCKAEVPMLDDTEFKQAVSLRGTGIEGDLRERQFGPVLREYERITGFRETNPNAIYHHQLSLYGPRARIAGDRFGHPEPNCADSACSGYSRKISISRDAVRGEGRVVYEP
jgi:hypothetical protein